MFNDRYKEALQSIKHDLSKYSHSSVFNTSIQYLSRPPKHGEIFAERMPWVIMFLIKQSLVGPSGSREISLNKLLGIGTRIFKLGDLLVDIPPEIMLLQMRSMQAQQSAYQVPSHVRLLGLLTQWTWMTYEDNFYEELFRKKTGVSLKNYYLMSLYLFSQAAKSVGNEVVRYSLRTFFIHLTPSVPPDEIASFLALAGAPFIDLSRFLKSKYEITDFNASELYQDTPLKFKPLLLYPEGIAIYSPAVCLFSFRAIVTEVMKGIPEYKNRFGSDVEARLGNFLLPAFKEVWPIEELSGIITLKTGKKADYVIKDGNSVLIVESKAVEPTELARCAFDPALLRKNLSDNFLKGITQGLETAHKLRQSGRFPGCNYLVLVVTLDDFFIHGGEFVSQFLDDTLFSKAEEKYGYLPVSPEDVIYITINDLVGISKWLTSNPDKSFSEVISRAREKEKTDSRNLAPTLSQVLQEEILAHVSAAAGVEEAMRTVEVEMSKSLLASKDYWAGKIPEFLIEFSRFQSLLGQKIADNRIRCGQFVVSRGDLMDSETGHLDTRE